jgi:hypothetical protein
MLYNNNELILLINELKNAQDVEKRIEKVKLKKMACFKMYIK